MAAFGTGWGMSVISTSKIASGFAAECRSACRFASGKATPENLFTIPCEAIFNTHPDVFRSALVGVGPRAELRPVVIVEPLPGRRPKNRAQRNRLIAELKSLAEQNQHTQMIRDFLIRKSLPVDIRHNVKINREQLAQWAARKLKAPRT